MLFAQAELVSRGADYGFVGWVLSVLFATAIAGVVWYARYIAIPQMETAKSLGERDQKNKEELTKAVTTLCAVAGDTHTLVADARQDTQASLAYHQAFALLLGIAVPVLRELGTAAKLDIGDKLARMEGVLEAIDAGSKVHRPIPQGGKG